MKGMLTKLTSRLLDSLSSRVHAKMKDALAAEIAQHLESIHRHHLAFYEQLAERMGEEFLKMHHDIDAIRNAKQLALVERLDEIRRAIEGMRDSKPAAAGPAAPVPGTREP
jgi:hypothetical protein